MNDAIKKLVIFLESNDLRISLDSRDKPTEKDPGASENFMTISTRETANGFTTTTTYELPSGIGSWNNEFKLLDTRLESCPEAAPEPKRKRRTAKGKAKRVAKATAAAAAPAAAPEATPASETVSL